MRTLANAGPTTRQIRLASPRVQARRDREDEIFGFNVLPFGPL